MNYMFVKVYRIPITRPTIRTVLNGTVPVVLFFVFFPPVPFKTVPMVNLLINHLWDLQYAVSNA